SLPSQDRPAPTATLFPYTTLFRSVSDGYDGWAATYDGEDNGCFPMRDDLLAPLLDDLAPGPVLDAACGTGAVSAQLAARDHEVRSEEHTSELQSRENLVCRLLLET